MLNKPFELVFEEGTIDLDAIADDEVVAETVVSVISPGSEMAAYAGVPALRDNVTYPRLVGYCNAARVLAVGSKVECFKAGDLVLSFQAHRSAFRGKQDVIITSLPDDDLTSRYTSAYLYHLGYNSLLKSDFRPGHNVAVIGLGALGLGAVAISAVGGGNVYAISGHEAGRNRALQAGAKVVLDRKDEESLLKTVDELTRKTGIDIIISTSNSWEDWLLAMKLARREGTIAVIGFPGRGEPPPEFNPLASDYFYYKQLKVISCGFSPDHEIPAHDLRFTQKRNMAYLLDLIREGRLDTDVIVTQKAQWNEIESIYQRMLARDPNLVTCALEWK